jgi:hypothetical protein
LDSSEQTLERAPGAAAFETAAEPLIDQLWQVPIGYHLQSADGREISLGAIARVNYLHDQRYEFTGNESTFGVESQMAGIIEEPLGWGQARLLGEFYLNQPFDRNRLVDYAERESFEHNFDVEPFEISQLTIDWSCGDWRATWGRFITPFGRYHLPLFSNARNDAHFVRGEVVLFRETGLLLEYQPRIWRLALAMTNGSDGRDTNSSKGVISRCGFDVENAVGGLSVKWHDGIGSEGQKEFNRYAGFDLLLRSGSWGLASEFVYDQHGMRRPGLDLNEISWGRSLYNRQLNIGWNKPISGVGYYTSLIYHDDCRTWTLGYGQYFPQQIGDPIHDMSTRRVLGQLQQDWSPHLSGFVTSFWENTMPRAQADRPRHGFFVLTGLQYSF